MKTYHPILVLFLVLALGTTTACSSDENTTNNNANKTDIGQQDTDNTVDTDNNNDKDIDEQQNDIDEQQDVENQENDAELPPDPEEDKRLLKDLTEEQILELCAIQDNDTNDFFDPASDTGYAYCLLFAAFAAYEAEPEPADKIALCELTVESCTSDDSRVNLGICINNTGCKATVTDFKRCSDASLDNFSEQTTPLLGKTCTDFTTEPSYQILNEAVDAYEYPQECKDLIAKCPNIYD